MLSCCKNENHEIYFEILRRRNIGIFTSNRNHGCQCISRPTFTSRISKPFVWKTPRYCIKFRTKNPYLNMAYMNILLRLTQTLCQSPWEISKDDLAEEYAALSYLTAEGFQLDWLGKKLDEVKVKKKKEKACLAQLREIEKELQPLKRKYSEMEAQMDKVKAELSAAKSPVSLYDEDVA
ncbi:unnamed protein product [Brassica oleracea]